MPSNKFGRGCKRPAIVASVSLAFGLKDIEGESLCPIAQIATLLGGAALLIAALACLVEAISLLLAERRSNQKEKHAQTGIKPEPVDDSPASDSKSPPRKTSIRELKRSGKSSKHKGDSKKKGKRSKNRR